MSDDAVPPNQLPTWGVCLIAGHISSILYGITCIQGFLYYQNWGNDNKRLKLFVAALLVIDTFSQAGAIYMAYWYFIHNFGDHPALNITHWTIGVEVLCNALMAFAVESFLCYRVWYMSNKNVHLTAIGIVLAVAHLACSFASLIEGLKYKTVVGGLAHLKVTGIVGLAIGVVEDSAIATALCYCLWRGRTGLRRTDNLIARLVSMSIATGVITSIFGLANLIAIAVAPTSPLVLAFQLPLAKLYLNSALASLNARSSMRVADQNTFNLAPTTVSISGGAGEFGLATNLKNATDTLRFGGTDASSTTMGADSIQKKSRIGIST